MGFLLATFAAATSPPPASAAPATIKAVTLNIWGGGNRGRTAQVTADVLRIVRIERPNVIALQEVCHSQHRALRAELRKLGYQATHTTTRKNALCRDGKNRYGNSLFVLGGFTARQRTVLPWGANPDTEHTGYEARAMVCATMKSPAGIRVCSTHLSPGNPDNQAQLDQVNTAIAPWVSRGQVVVLGDFNQHLSPVLSRLGFGQRPQNPRAVDHAITNTPSRVRTLWVQCSDHRAVVSTIEVKK